MYYMGTVPMTGIFDKAVIFFCLPRDIEKVALRLGSSIQGKALLASVGENCVAATHLKKGNSF